MADSEDEYDRKRRDKFRGERNEYTERGGANAGGNPPNQNVGGRGRDDRQRRDDWGSERGDPWTRNRPRSGGNQDYRDYQGGGARRDGRYSPVRSHDLSPPLKRMRTDWDDRRYGHPDGYGGSYGSWGGYEGYGSHSNYGSHGLSRSTSSLDSGVGGGRDASAVSVGSGPSQPPMLSFKAFLSTQDDAISDEEAIKKYAEYKLEFRRQQLNEFFVAHREEEWFKHKYHPEECQKRKDEQISALKKRVSVFTDLLDNKWMEGMTLDADCADQLVRLLDAVVVKLEGGTDLDLKILDEKEPEVEITHKSASPKKTSDEAPPKTEEVPVNEDEKEEPAPTSETTADVSNDEGSEQTDLQHRAKELLAKKDAEETEAKDEPQPKKLKKKENNEDGSNSEGSSDSSSNEDSAGEDEEEPTPPGLPLKEPVVEKDASRVSPHGRTDTWEVDDDDEVSQSREKKEEVKKDDQPEKMDVDQEPRPRALHKTASIFLRNLAPTITKVEVEAMCKRYPGFLRVAIADPQPERRWFRRGWVTFERSVNIKEICWNLNNIRLRDCELGAIVNRDLSRRVRTVNGITAHRQVARQDVRLAAKIVQNLDSRWGLWGTAVAKKDGKISQGNSNFGDDTDAAVDNSAALGLLHSSNPVLKNITDYLIEEASAEEEELLGGNGNAETSENTANSSEGDAEQKKENSGIERDEELLKVLDRLLLYLRIVHSVDYYNQAEYPSEDEMPNRCGIIHARGPVPSSKVGSNDVTDYCTAFETKASAFLQPTPTLNDEDCKQLGLKEPESEVEKFVSANTQELAKDKWLCPLSGKKFKGPEYIRKHIFNKHGEKVDEVKKEVEYFNNYLRDPRRPQLPEHPGNKAGGSSAVSSNRERDNAMERGGYGAGGHGYQGHYGMGYNAGRHGGGGAGYGNSYGRDGYGNREPYRDMYSGGSRQRANYGRNARLAPPLISPPSVGRAPAPPSARPLVGYDDLDAPDDRDTF